MRRSPETVRRPVLPLPATRSLPECGASQRRMAAWRCGAGGCKAAFSVILARREASERRLAERPERHRSPERSLSPAVVIVTSTSTAMPGSRIRTARSTCTTLPSSSARSSSASPERLTACCRMGLSRRATISPRRFTRPTSAHWWQPSHRGTRRRCKGSIDADFRVRGTGLAPSFAGRVAAPEGSINGLSFRDFESGVSGDANDVSVTNGRVVVGSSPIALMARANRAGARDVSLQASQLNLADFNDFFDTGDTLEGIGSLVLRARLAGTRVLSTSGDANVSNARYRAWLSARSLRDGVARGIRWRRP